MAKQEGLPRLSEKEGLILRLLTEAGGESYGLHLVKRSGKKLARGTVYVTLDRMEGKGYVRSRRDSFSQSDSQAVPRRVYRLTGLGQRVLAAAQQSAGVLEGLCL
jgi:DNA-binding PadR family transcriptional regulator